jgi:hypothetical protein
VEEVVPQKSKTYVPCLLHLERIHAILHLNEKTIVLPNLVKI